MTWECWRANVAVKLVLSAAAAAVCPHLAHAECHAKDFDPERLKTLGRSVADSTDNLDALERSASGTPTLLLLGTAVEDTDRAASEAIAFAGYLLIYQGMTNDADRKVADDVIRHFAPAVWQAIRGRADSITLVATKLPQYGGELRDARDRVRKLQALFSCAEGDDK